MVFQQCEDIQVVVANGDEPGGSDTRSDRTSLGGLFISASGLTARRGVRYTWRGGG
jgi:hypothetical protein